MNLFWFHLELLDSAGFFNSFIKKKEVKQSKKPKKKEITRFQQEILDETNSKNVSFSLWNSFDKGLAKQVMEKVYKEILSPELSKNGLTISLDKRGVPIINRGRSVVVFMDGTEKAYIDGLMFDVIKPGKSSTKKYTKIFARTTGDKYEVARGISHQISESLPKLAEEADVMYEPYGASLSFTMNLDQTRTFIRNGGEYHVSVSSYFEPEKSLIYNAMKKGGEEAKGVLREINAQFFKKNPSGKYGAAIKKIFNAKQLEKARENFWDFQDLLSRDNLILEDKLDNKIFKMARDDAKNGKKVVLIDDSNYASLPYESSKDVYNDVLKSFNKLVNKGEMAQSEVDEIVNFAKSNNIPLDGQFSKNPKYLLWQKKKTYDALSQNYGIIIATNNASPDLVRGLSEYDGNIKVFWHNANWTADTELGISLRNQRPEYLAILGDNNEAFTKSRRKDSFFSQERFSDFGSTTSPKGGVSRSGREIDIHTRKRLDDDRGTTGRIPIGTKSNRGGNAKREAAQEQKQSQKAGNTKLSSRHEVSRGRLEDSRAINDKFSLASQKKESDLTSPNGTIINSIIGNKKPTNKILKDLGIDF